MAKRSKRFLGLTDKQREALFPYIMLSPALIAVLGLSFYPIFLGLRLSFYDYTLLYQSRPFIGWQNYSELMRDTTFWSSLTNTILYTVLNGVGSTIIGLAVALLLNRSSRIRGFLRSFSLFPWVVPSVVVSYVWMWFFQRDFSPINDVLMRLGLIADPIAFLGNLDWGIGPFTLPFLSVLAVRLWTSFPMKAVMLLAGLQSIPGELYEAATIDGASVWQQFRHITLPMLVPVLGVILTLTLIWNFGHFDTNYLMTQGGPRNATNVMAVAVYLMGFGQFRLGYAAAMGGVMLLVTSVIAIVYVTMLAKRDEL
ncbi:MAG: sugar ABC transporter permease [Firmicutes bacterium]|nr:sugar ABC transporter permease [Bacillota bacterium]